MSKTEPSQTAESSQADFSFEQAFEQLETVVEEMENGQIPLDDLIDNYEAGTRLFRICQKRLEEARGRIEIIRKKVDGKEEIEPFEPDSAGASESETSESGSAKTRKLSLKEDGELF